MKNTLDIPTALCYKKMHFAVFRSREQLIKKKLQQLYPLENVDKKYEKYCIKKLAAVFMVLFIGFVSVICSVLCSRNENKLTEGALLIRNERGEGNYTVTLQASTGDWVKEIPVVVEERELTIQEKAEAVSKMPFLLLKQMEYPSKPEPKEVFFSLLQEEISVKSKEEKTKKEFFLPQEIEGKGILWKENTSRKYLGTGILIILGAVLAGSITDREIEKEQKKRSRQLLMDYPGCVNKLRLYLSAGLTVRNAFIRITEDYHKQVWNERHYLYEEMVVACHQLQNGMMEEKVYEDWGRRCKEMRIKRLSYLLAVHVKKGNAQLLELLMGEAQGAQEDRRSQAKKLGEEAGTKLLFPMMLMLLVVMFLILLPTWMNFGTV